MAVQVARTSSLHWCPPLPLPLSNHGSHCSSSSASAVHAFASVLSSVCSQTATAAHHSSFLLGGSSSRLLRSRSCDAIAGRRIGRRLALGRAYSANLEDFVGGEDDEELVQRTRELSLKPQQQRQQPKDEGDRRAPQAVRCTRSTGDASSSNSLSSSDPVPPPISSLVIPVRRHGSAVEPPWFPLRPEPAEWPDQMVEKNANRTELPLSLRIIKERKKKMKTWDDGIREAGESTCCSVNKAFSSMVFIVREVQTHAIHLRELLVDEDLRGILDRVHREMNSSFVWLFQKVFSCTPTLMVSVMLLLANFTVYSMGHSVAVASPAPSFLPGQSAIVVVDNTNQSLRSDSRFDGSIAKTFSSCRTASIGGRGDGGGKVRPVAGAMDDGQPDEIRSSRGTALPDGTSSTIPETVNREEEGGIRSGSTRGEDEASLWQDMVDEAYRMRALVTDESLLDAGILRRLVSPVTADLELDDYSEEYLKTELMYQQALSKDPDNVLLLCNFAQFIHLVLHDNERAEYYFKKAVAVRPADAEALSRYASFLWLGKNDLAAAEETYLDAIAADPNNTAHAANYAHFLWNTGGEDTCYPLDTDEA